MSAVSDPIRQDPTALTTSQLQRELGSMEKVFQGELRALRELVEGVVKAHDVFRQDLVRVPTAVDKAVGQLKELHEKWFLEKFDAVEGQFIERDTRTEQLARAGELALTAALSAAKEAVEKQNTASALAIAKAETGTAKQIDQLAQLFQTSIGALDGKFNDLKERVLLIEGRTVGQTAEKTTTQTNQQMSQGFLFSMIAAGVGIAGLLTTLFVLVGGK